ncbi:MAG: ABC transporter ATP-binding protein, partial [Bacillota bacterium]|nr:ABC transporter ATP-binding protein [Bacillota bacterium]
MSEQKSSGNGPSHGPPMGGKAIVKAKNFKGSAKKLIEYLKPFRWMILVVALFAAISSIFAIVGPRILANATDEIVRGVSDMITGGSDGIDFGYIRNIILMITGLYFTSAAFAYFQGHIMAGVSTKVSYNLRNAIMEKINRLPLSYFHKTSHGQVLSRITNDVDTLNQSLNQSITQIITSFTTVVGVLVMMLTISWQLTMVAVCIIPVSLILMISVMKKSQKHFRNQQKQLGEVNGHVEEMYSGHTVMKAFNGEKRSIQKFDASNDKLYESAWKSQFLSGLIMPIMSFVGNISYVVICILGASMAATG